MTKIAAIPLAARFGLARYRPAGSWVVATPPEGVVGTAHQLDNMRAFSAAVRRAERYGLRYGLRLQRDSDRAEAEDTITVFGIVETRGPLGGRRQMEWPVGVLSRGLTRRVVDQFLDKGSLVEAELISIIEQPDTVPLLSLAILVPAQTVSQPRRPHLTVVH
ncbi:MAG: hypothetical protein KJZ59_02980 [Pararhodobacter sp.]|nr:hypothetical protein [Pararhodobacter sp.]